MKIYYILIITIFLASCSRKKKTPNNKIGGVDIENQIVKLGFQSIIDSAEVIGSILIYDLEKNVYFSNDYEWANKGNLPASTFKITNSIIGLECGVIESDSIIFKWDGEEKWLKNWEQDLILKDAFHFSCVPCYQEVAKKIGEKRMNEYLNKFNYGHIKVDSTNLNNFWLEGDARISQMEQINFLKRFYDSQLPITDRTEKIMKSMMVITENEEYKLNGKSGLSNSNQHYNGWFVGYIELANKAYLFATNIEPEKEFDFDTFIKQRKNVTFKALKHLNILN